MIERIESIGKRYVHYLTMLHEVSIEGIHSPMSDELMKKFKHISGAITQMQKDITDFSVYFLKAFPRLDEPIKTEPMKLENVDKIFEEVENVGRTG
jgi:hypothetical protein